jgi:uncharacterized membrane protein YphA (DoxX/SURF4 family)
VSDDWIVFVRLALACVFVLAAVSKLRMPDAFQRTLARFGLSPRLSRYLARLLPASELAVSGLLLLGGRIGSWGLLLAAAMLIGFSTAALWAVAHRWHVGCTCFGVSQTTMSWPLVLRNLVLAAIASTAGAWQLLGQSTPAGPWWHVFLLAPPAVATGLLVPVLSDALESIWQSKGSSVEASQ